MTVTPSQTPYAAAAAVVGRRVAECELADRLRRLADDGRLSGAYADDSAEALGLPTPADVLSVDVAVYVDVVLTLGGPTAYIRYYFTPDVAGAYDYSHAEYHTTEPAYAPGVDSHSGMTVVTLDDSDAEALADAYVGGVDTLAESLRSA